MTTTTEIASSKAVATRRNYSFLFALTLLGLLLLLCIVLTFASPNFLTDRNITNVLRQASVISILAIGETFVIITAGIDLSIGAVVGFATLIVAMLLQAGVPAWIAIIVTMVAGLAIGAFHGFGITKMGLPPFIITLATMTSLKGVGYLMTDGNSISVNDTNFTGFATEAFLGIPALFWLVIIVAIPAYVLLNHTRWGRYIFAVGSNPESARLSGVRISSIIYLAYCISGLLAAIVGVMTAMRIGVANARTGEGWELQAIAASVIGGTSLFGAIGSVHGPLIGALILTVIANGANLLNINSFWQQVITGLLIILIVFFDQLRRRGR